MTIISEYNITKWPSCLTLFCTWVNRLSFHSEWTMLLCNKLRILECLAFRILPHRVQFGSTTHLVWDSRSQVSSQCRRPILRCGCGILTSRGPIHCCGLKPEPLPCRCLIHSCYDQFVLFWQHFFTRNFGTGVTISPESTACSHFNWQYFCSSFAVQSNSCLTRWVVGWRVDFDPWRIVRNVLYQNSPFVQSLVAVTMIVATKLHVCFHPAF